MCDSNSESQFVAHAAPCFNQPVHCLAHFNCRLDRLKWGVRKLNGIVEDDHYTVAGIALERALMLVNYPAYSGMVFSEKHHYIFRIRALRENVEAGRFCGEHRRLALLELTRKCRIYAGGCRKRGREQEAQRFLQDARKYERMLR